MTALREASLNWAIGVLATFAILIGMACLDRNHSETEAAALTAQVTQDRADELAAINNPKE